MAEPKLPKQDDFMKMFGIKPSDLKRIEDLDMGWLGLVVGRKKEKNDG
jgi:hypothetical protein